MVKLETIDKVNLANLPTRIHELKRLRDVLGGPRLFVKRDDETGLAFGGNKVRKLEYIIADAIKHGAEVIITSGGAQSNHCRLTAAAAVSFGLKPVLVITDAEPAMYRGNLALDHLFGADLHFIPGDRGSDIANTIKKGEAKVNELKDYYERKGKKAYVVPRGGRSSQGTAAYITATLEMYQQIVSKRIRIDYLVTTVGSGSTFGSLLLANKLFNTGVKPIGISVAYDAEECRRRIFEQAEADKKYFGFNVEITREDVVIFDRYIGPGYAVPTAEGMDAIELMAQTEAILLDPNYTGKAMAGLIDLIKTGYFSDDECVLFLHTGGTPALFALGEQLNRK